MKIEGKCDFCGATGDWEAGLFYVREEAKTRPLDWAAMLPLSRARLPEGCTFDPQKLEHYGVETTLACPNCFRGK